MQHLGVGIPILMHSIGCHGYGKGCQPNPYEVWPIFVVDGIPKQNNM